jgi:hypothetical protein
MYEAGGRGAGLDPVEVSAGDIASMPTSQERPVPDDWPDEAVASYVPASDDATGAVCAQLQTSEGAAGKITLATPVDDSSAVPEQQSGARSVEVDNGHGALVQVNGGGVVTHGTVYVVDASGTRYSLGGTVADTMTRLGYGDVTPADVPIAWADLFPDGPELSRERAWRPAVSQ